MEKVEVTWVDSKGGIAGWEFKDELKSLNPVAITSVGYLFEKTDQYITIIQSDSDKQIFSRLSIPNGAIQKMQILTSKDQPIYIINGKASLMYDEDIKKAEGAA